VRGRHGFHRRPSPSRGSILAVVILVWAVAESEGSRFVSDLSRALERLTAATDVVDLLDSAREVFERLLAVLRRHQEDKVSAFPAFVLAGCAAANGRDWTGGAWTPLLDATRQDAADDPINGATIAELAVVVADASHAIATRLSACALSAPDEAVRVCCEGAAAEAATICTLMGGASPP